MAPQLIRFPTEGDYDDFYALVPEGMTARKAVSIANRIIKQANIEDARNEFGGCDDGLTVGQSIRKRLGAVGFVFPKVADTLAWDASYADEEDLAPSRAP